MNLIRELHPKALFVPYRVHTFYLVRQVHSLWILDRHLDHMIPPMLEQIIRCFDLIEHEGVRDQRCGVDLTLGDEVEDLAAIAAVDTTGFEDQIFAVHVGQGGGVVLRHRGRRP